MSDDAIPEAWEPRDAPVHRASAAESATWAARCAVASEEAAALARRCAREAKTSLSTLLATRDDPASDFGATVNVLRKGALTGNAAGSAQTNHSAFQAAIIELLGLGGGVLLVPPGRYAMDVAIPIIIPSNVSLHGEPGASIIVPDVSTVVDVATRPFPLANGAVFVSGNPVTGQRAAIENATACTGIHIYGLDIECDYAQGTLTSGQQLRGFAIYATTGVSVVMCRAENLPNTGFCVQDCVEALVTNNRAVGNGYGQPDPLPATRNGITASGLIVHPARLENSYSIVVAQNICNYNHDEGIQYGLQGGVVVSDNVCTGNGDLGIEGDTSFSTTGTATTLGFEVPSQALITGNYIDGRTRTDGVVGHGGIGFSGGNEGTCLITGNMVRHVAGKMGISASQNNGGCAVIEDNTLQNVDPGVSYHQIQSNMQRTAVRGNRIFSPGSTNSHNAVFCFGNVNQVSIEGNFSESIPLSFVRVSADTDNFSTLIVKGNVCLGCGADGVIFATGRAQTIGLLEVSGNTLQNVNGAGASDKRAVRLFPSANTFLVSVDQIVIRGNTATYAGATLYPVGVVNFQPGAIGIADVRHNHWGEPTLPTGIRSCDTANGIAQLIDNNNVMLGTEIASFSTYNLYADAANFERGAAVWRANEFTLGTEKAGTGVNRAIAFEVGGTKVWSINENGHLLPYADAGWDFGTATNRVRQIRQFGVHVNGATVIATPGNADTVSVASSTNCQICDPATALSAMTVAFPVSQGDGHEFELIVTAAIGNLTLSPYAGQSIHGGITGTSGYTSTKWRYVLARQSWYRVT